MCIQFFSFMLPSALLQSPCCRFPVLTLLDKVTSPNPRADRHQHAHLDRLMNINTHFPLLYKHIYKWSTHTYDQSWLINWLKQFFTAQRLQGRYLRPYVVCINHKSDQSDDWSSDSPCFCIASARPNVISCIITLMIIIICTSSLAHKYHDQSGLRGGTNSKKTTQTRCKWVLHQCLCAQYRKRERNK